MKKTSMYFVGATMAALALLGLAGQQMSQPRSQATTTKTVLATKKKVSAKQRNQAYYAHPQIEVKQDQLLLPYPKDFAGFVAKGELTVTGVVTKLQPVVVASTAYTLATVKVEQVLAGSGATVEQQIPVLFSDGVISKRTLLADVATKTFMTAKTDDTQVTVKYPGDPLPQIGQQYALVLSQETAGTNGLATAFWMANYGSKGIFVKHGDQYQREAQSTSSSSGATHDLQVAEDQLMNAGMTKLSQQ